MRSGPTLPRVITLAEEAGGRKECTDSPPHPSPASNLSSGILQLSFTGVKWRGRGAGSSPQRNPLSPTPALRSSGTGSPGAGVSDSHPMACSQHPPQRARVWGSLERSGRSCGFWKTEFVVLVPVGTGKLRLEPTLHPMGSHKASCFP